MISIVTRLETTIYDYIVIKDVLLCRHGCPPDLLVPSLFKITALIIVNQMMTYAFSIWLEFCQISFGLRVALSLATQSGFTIADSAHPTSGEYMMIRF